MQQSVDAFSDQIHQGAGLSRSRGEPDSAKMQSGQALHSRYSQVNVVLWLQRQEGAEEEAKGGGRGNESVE